ncbi:sensor histidine kinase [Gordonia sp. DT30]|uniref:sensor histidine kinase n=1 Tax=Gordonia sp. DT30 TaxID=3416546 RepID=UPI003CF6E51F
MLRAVVSVPLVVSAALGAGSVPGWRLATGWAATAVLVGAVFRGMFAASATDRILGQDSMVFSAVTIAAATAAGLAFGGAATVWVPLLGVAAAALAPVGIWITALLAVPPVAAIVVQSWWLDREMWTVVIDLAIALLVFGWVHLRRYRREADELAAAQRQIIEGERARAAAAEDRQVLAAQLHDVLAHTLSGLIITVQGAALAARREGVSPELTEKLDTAAALARDGLAEARDAVRSLRGDDDSPLGSGGESLSDWTASTIERLHTATGLEITVTGSAADVDTPWVALAKSVVMEGLTNSLRHAAGAPVRIEFGATTLRVLSVGAPDEFSDRDHPSGAYGLAGLAERVALAGGTLTHGPCEEGFDLTMRMTS